MGSYNNNFLHQDAIDGGDAHGVCRVEVRVVEDEWRGVPDAAPAGGERGGAHGVLDGEAGDAAPAEVVGESADAVHAVIGLPIRGGEGSVHGDG